MALYGIWFECFLYLWPINTLKIIFSTAQHICHPRSRAMVAFISQVAHKVYYILNKYLSYGTCFWFSFLEYLWRSTTFKVI